LSSLEESLGVSSGLVARLPKWVRELLVGVSMDKSVQALVITKRKIQALVKHTQFPVKAIPVPVKTPHPPVKLFTSNCGHTVSEKQAAKGGVASDTLFHFGESLELSNLRETLLKLKEEVGVCLMRLDSAVDGLLGSEPKLSLHHAQPNCGAKLTSKDWVVKQTCAFKPKLKGPVFKPKSRAASSNVKLLVGSGVGQELDPKGKVTVTGGSARSWVALDAGQSGDPGGVPAVLQPPVSTSCSL